MRRTVFLDRDGVLNDKRPEGDYVKSVGEFRLIVGVPEAIRTLASAGLRLIVTTNQRGIALGRMTEADVHAIHRDMAEKLGPAKLYAVYYCPHDKGECHCRKPGVGMFRRAAADCPEIDFASALVVGDSLADLQAAAALQSRAILIATGVRRDEILQAAAREALPVFGAAACLFEALPLILEASLST